MESVKSIGLIAVILLALTFSPVASARQSWPVRWQIWYNAHAVQPITEVFGCHAHKIPASKTVKANTLHLCDVEIHKACFRAVVDDHFHLLMPMLLWSCFSTWNPAPIKA